MGLTIKAFRTTDQRTDIVTGIAWAAVIILILWSIYVSWEGSLVFEACREKGNLVSKTWREKLHRCVVCSKRTHDIEAQAN